MLQSPLLAPLHPVISIFEDDYFPSIEVCNALLDKQRPSITVQQGQPLRFVKQALGKQSFESQYEPRCYLKGEVQMREANWHDLLNALVWLTFPKSKAAINALHYHALTNVVVNRTSSQRGVVRDVNTLLDESGVIVVCSDTELEKLLRSFQWQELFWQRREHVKSNMGFYIFGHGLYEKALSPYIGMTGQGVVLSVAQSFFAWTLPQQLAYIDDCLAKNLNEPSHYANTCDLAPVPLLGVPGWHQENENQLFYSNANYFRAGRLRFAQRGSE